MKFSHLSAIILTVSLAACTATNGGGSTSSASSSSSAAMSSAASSNDNIDVTAPHANSLVTSPLTVTGKARGWYFEASFPVHLLDGNGHEIAVGPAQAQGDWMTEDFVPFSVTLNFATPSTPTGTLVLENDNPSGLPENSQKITIPVRFK